MIVFIGAENHSKNPIGSVVAFVNVPLENVPVGRMNDSTINTKKQIPKAFNKLYFFIFYLHQHYSKFPYILHRKNRKKVSFFTFFP